MTEGQDMISNLTAECGYIKHSDCSFDKFFIDGHALEAYYREGHLNMDVLINKMKLITISP